MRISDWSSDVCSSDQNDSWASTTIAHNTLVVDEQSHFAGDWKTGEKHGTRQLAASLEGPTRYTVAEIDSAYKDVTIRRALLLIEVEGLDRKRVVWGKRGSERVDQGGRRISKTQNNKNTDHK